MKENESQMETLKISNMHDVRVQEGVERIFEDTLYDNSTKFRRQTN